LSCRARPKEEVGKDPSKKKLASPPVTLLPRYPLEEEKLGEKLDVNTKKTVQDLSEAPPSSKTSVSRSWYAGVARRERIQEL
jgi:hypothetical protein